MSETVHSPANSMTPLAATLASPELRVLRGVLTPWALDAPETETAALMAGAAVHDLGWMQRVAVRGEDRFRWLSGMVTNTVTDLPANGGAWNLVLNAQGRIQGDLHVWRNGDALEIELAADQAERLLTHLDRFIIMDDVELVPLSDGPDGQTALGLAGPLAAGVLLRLGLPAPDAPMTSALGSWNGANLRVVRGYEALAPHFEIWTVASIIPALLQALVEAGAQPVGAATLEAFRIAEGIPLYGVDIVERDLAQETSQMRALHFSKGCYLGQEIVERIRSRGNVHRHLRSLELQGPLPAPGAELAFDSPSAGPGAPAGHITSAAELALPSGPRCFALGMIRGEAELRDQPLTYTAGTGAGAARILAAAPEL